MRQTWDYKVGFEVPPIIKFEHYTKKYYVFFLLINLNQIKLLNSLIYSKFPFFGVWLMYFVSHLRSLCLSQCHNVLRFLQNPYCFTFISTVSVELVSAHGVDNHVFVTQAWLHRGQLEGEF